MLVDKENELMSNLLFTVHQHGGDDVTWKPPMLPVATAIQLGAQKINARALCVRVLCKTRRSFIRSFSRLSLDALYLRTGVKGCSKIRRVLATSRLILDEMWRLYGKFASYLRRVLHKTRLIFPRINDPNNVQFSNDSSVTLTSEYLQCS